MLVLVSTADRTHLGRHPRARVSELGHPVREAVDSQSSRPDLRSEDPLRGWYLVP